MKEVISGQRFGHWTVKSHSVKSLRYWLCRCDCGTEKDVRADHLISGKTNSCGCLRSTTHGGSKTALYSRWRGMMARCYNSNHKQFADYGGRGITVCERWMSFEFFRDDMAPTFNEALEIDRRENDIGYCPSNCRWVTHSEQMRNTRRNRLITFAGETHILTDWAKKIGKSNGCLRNRLARGWTLSRALSAITVTILIAALALMPYRPAQAQHAQPRFFPELMCALVVIGVGAVVYVGLRKMCKAAGLGQNDGATNAPPPGAEFILPPQSPPQSTGPQMTLMDDSGVMLTDYSANGWIDPVNGAPITGIMQFRLQSSTDFQAWHDRYVAVGWVSAAGATMLYYSNGVPGLTNYLAMNGTNYAPLPLCDKPELRQFFRLCCP